MLNNLSIADRVLEEVLKKKQALMIANMSGGLEDHHKYNFNCGAFGALAFVEETLKEIVKSYRNEIEGHNKTTDKK